MTEISSYTLKPLWNDAEFVSYRGQRETEPSHILIVAPLSQQPAQGTLRRLEHGYALRTRLDPAWAVLPLALVSDNGRTTLVLEDPGGEPLDGILKGPLELTVFLRIAVGLAATLVGLHGRGLIHKDIRPANVMVNPTADRVWLTGFGIASDLPRERQAPEPPETIAGTLAYMAPEQTGRMNRSIDSRSDLYSLGVTLYEMLTGTPPFAANDPLEWVHCHIARQPAPPKDLRKDIPKTLSAIVLKLLAKTAEERYQTAAGLEADLRRCLQDWESLGRIDPFLLRANDASDRLLIPEKLYGRHRESKALLEAFDRVVASGMPELVLVSGYSGIGKSSIVNELHRVVVLPRGIFISGKFDQQKRGIPYSTLAQAFETLVHQILSKNEAEIGRWQDAIRDAVGPNGQLVVNLVPELELVIGKQPPAPELPSQEAPNRFDAVLRAFIGVFARKEHPLVIFLDDLQWLDAATLKLIEDLVTHPDVQYLLLIGAYRDNEVIPGHPLLLRLDSIRKAKAIVRDIVLAPLSFDNVNRLVADSVLQERTSTLALARLVHKKTAGNPFFTIQFLTVLAEEHLLEFDSRERTWRWDIDRIRARAITDNAADLLIKKLNRLPERTRTALKQLACLGNNADTAALTMLRGGSEAEVHSDLREAVLEGSVVRLDGSYKFVHDRIQETAYALIPDETRAEAHLRIGRLLIERMSPTAIEENIFDVVNQLNRGAALIFDRNEKQRLAELNFRAGRKAKTSTAYAAACAYLSAGATLLDHLDWESRYELWFGICLLRAECEVLCGRFDEAEGLISSLLERAVSKADKAAAYRLKTDLHIIKSEYQEAVDSALECLGLFGIEMSVHPTREQVQCEYEKVWRNLGGRSIESLADLPLMTDEEIQATMRVLSVLYSPAFFIDTNLFSLSICHIVNLSLKYGATDASAHGYAYFGFILGPAYNRYAEGYRFGQLSVSLVEKYEFAAYKAKVYMTMAWVAIWTQPIRTALEFIRAAFSAAVEIGDVTYACYACDHTITDRLARGDYLEEVWRESEKCLDFVRKTKSRDYVDRITTQQQFIQNMQGRTNTFSTFSDSHFDEAAFEAQLPGDRAIACWYWILKLQARLVSEDYETAIAAAQKAKRLLWAATGCIQLLDYHYYTALAIAALFETASPNQQNEWRETLTTHLEQLREWAEHCSISFLDKYALVSAEVARIEGRDLDAMRFYEQAIRYARQSGFQHNEALANEIAGKFYLGHGLEMIGHTYLRNARYCYTRWGAHGKVKQLEKSHPNLREGPAPLHPMTTLGATVEQLDLATVVKMSQAVSGEILLEKLIDTLMVIALEHAGAERGLLILAQGDEQQIEAQATTGGKIVTVRLCQTFVTPAELPESILRYVIRTRKSVILDDASAQNLFSADEYLRRRQSRSVLCVPLLKQGELIGALYLENNLAPRVFTPEHLAVLELLASQAAISLENARLYAGLGRLNAELTKENTDRTKAEEALRASEDRWRKLFENSSAGIALCAPDGRFIAANLALQKMLGYTEEELQGLTPKEFTLEEDLAATEARIAQCRDGQRRDYRIEKRLLRKNGDVIWTDISAVFVTTTGSVPAFFAAVIVDITDRKRAEEEIKRIRRLEGEMRQASRTETMGGLTASLAHELNQPLGAVRTNAQAARRLLAGKRPESLPEVKAAIEDIIADIIEDNTRAAEIIRNVRALFQRGKVEMSRVDLHQILYDTERIVRADAIMKNVTLRLDLPASLPTVIGNRTQLVEALMNLVLNAFDSVCESADGPREVEIRASQPEPRQIHVSVRDSGKGIEPDVMPRLFDAFFTTKPQGMGMGLAIVRSIIENHGGRLWATRNPDRGATFEFDLPTKTDLNEAKGETSPTFY
jgi:PAS domain S-box-containing protein